MTLSAAEFLAQAPAGWQAEGTTARARFTTGSFASGVDLVDEIGRLADAANHHPDVLLRYPDVTLTLTTHDAGGLTARDVALARVVTEAATSRGIAIADG